MKCFMQDITKGKRQGNQKMGTDSESKKPMKTTSPTSFLSQEGSYLVIINYAHPLQPHTGGSSGGVSPPHPRVAGLEKIDQALPISTTRAEVQVRLLPSLPGLEQGPYLAGAR